MSERPILIFPSRTSAARKVPSGGAQPFHGPDRQRQVDRLDDRINSLTTTFQNRTVSISSTADGRESEMILVFELRGSVNDFFVAVSRIPALEWMGEYEDAFVPDADFFNPQNPRTTIAGKVYFVLSNYTTLQEIIRLWNLYRQGTRFPRGFTPWRNLFSLLYDIRPWGLQDRLEETGLSQDILLRNQMGQTTYPFEIELWYRSNERQRALASERIRTLVETYGGWIVSESVIDGIAYHALLANAPIDLMQHLNAETDVELFKADDVMFFRPVGQCAVVTTAVSEVSTVQDVPSAQPTQAPIIALLDGLPMQNHALLQNRIIVDDPNNYETDYPADKRVHGTGMASIIVHGDRNLVNEPISSQLYVRPVMKYDISSGRNAEAIPEDRLAVDVIHEAVVGIFTNAQLQSSIKVINLSLGDIAQPFINRVSAWARLLDWLAFQYNVLFIVSAGNCLDDIDLGLTAAQYSGLTSNAAGFDSAVLKSIYNNSRHRRLLSPAESINSLTVGAIHHDNSSTINLRNNVGVFSSAQLFSPISRLGSGYRRSIKPDVLMPGGRIFFQDPSVRGRLVISQANIAPGVLAASPEGLDRTRYARGTSNSAALLTRSTAFLYQALQEDNFFDRISHNDFPTLAKTLLVHSASWNSQTANWISRTLNLSSEHHTVEKAVLSKLLGYGNVNEERVFTCTEKRVTVISCGSLTEDAAEVYEFPLPVSLSGVRSFRKLIVTLGWLTPISPKNQKYRKAKLWYDFPTDDQRRFLSVENENYDHHAVNRGTIQHQVFEANVASAFVADSTIKIRVNCREDAGDLTETTRYAIAVTLEVDDALQIDIYNEIRQSVQPQVRPNP